MHWNLSAMFSLKCRQEKQQQADHMTRKAVIEQYTGHWVGSTNTVDVSSDSDFVGQEEDKCETKY